MAKNKEDPGFFGGGGFLGTGLGRTDPDAPAPPPPPKVKSTPVPKQVHRSEIDANNPWVKSARGQEEAAVKATGGKFKRSEESGVNPNLPWVKTIRERDARIKSPATVAPPAGGGGKKVTKRQTTTVTPTPRPQATVKPQAAVRGVQSWRGGDVPQQVRYDPGTKPNPSKKQRAAAGARHDFSGLKGFFK
jgi:hypothetical protein